MDFNFDTGAIYGGLQSLDVTTLPPLGGQAGVLTILGTGAITLPQGTSLEQPVTPAAGMFRYNSDNTALEYYDSVSWVQLSVGGGTVTSVAASSSSAALTVTGSPITSSGTLAFSLDADLTALAALSGTGYAVRTAADTWTTRLIEGTAGNIVVTDGNAVNGNTVVDLAPVTQGTSNNFVKVTLDGFGRVTGNSAVTTADITTLVDGTYANIAGDTMTGNLNMGGNSITNLATPVNGGDAVTKDYADALANGLSWKTSAASAAFTYDGSGRLLTATRNNRSYAYTHAPGSMIITASDGATMTATFDGSNRVTGLSGNF